MDIYREIYDALREEGTVVLATIVGVSGSTPAADSSKLLLKGDGLVSVGTVGGGCIEAEVIGTARSIYGKGTSKLSTFHLDQDDAESGSICGGTLDVLIESLDRSSLAVFEALATSRMEGVDTALITLFKGSQGSEKLLMKPTGERIGEGWCDNLEMPLVERALEVIHSHKKERIKLADSMELIIEPILGYPSLVIFGGGHVSKFISGFAKTCGFKVTIVDDRIQFANKERFPEVDAIVCESFAQSFEKLDISASSYVVIVTRGHKYDEQILERVLEFDAKYIGMIGSKRKVLTTFQHLVGKGVSKENLQRVYAPIGLEIGAITPEEIGLSIVSELIKIRRLGDDGPSRHMSRGLPVSDIETGCQ